MDDNVMRVLQMLQDGKISSQEAETLIAALRGESAAPKPEDKPDNEKDNKKTFSPFDKIKPPKIDLDDLGERISQAISRVQPEKILKRVQAQIRTVSRSGAHWSATVTARVRNWTEGEDKRPTNGASYPEQTDSQEQEFHLESGSTVMVENPLGNVTLTAIPEGPSTVVIRKTVWTVTNEELKAALDQMEVHVHGTDSRLDIKVSAPDFFRDGTVDLELKVPVSATARISTHFGDVDLSGIEGRAEAVTTTGGLSLHDLGGDARGETGSGDLKLERIAGMATVASQSGNITAEDIRRGLSANTASGHVRAVNVEGGRVECKSVSGDVHAEKMGQSNPLDIIAESISGGVTLLEAKGNIALKAVSGEVKADNLSATRLQANTVSGEVHIRLTEVFSGTMQVSTVSGKVFVALPEGSNVRASLSTTSGELRCEHDADNVTATETLWSGQIGTGAGTLTVQTISGGTQILRA